MTMIDSLLRRRAFVAALSCVSASRAGAGLVDLFNGVVVGRKLPDYTFTMLSGERPNSGKPIFIEFWATWCSSCKTGVPHMNELFAEWAPRGVEFLALSAEATDVALPAIREFGMKYPVAVDMVPSLHAGLDIKGFPYALLADREGVVLWRGQPKDADDQLFESLASAVIKPVSIHPVPRRGKNSQLDNAEPIV